MGDVDEISPGVFAFPHSVVDGRNAIVFGKSGVLAVDSCVSTQESAAMVRFITAHDRTPDHLAVTHGHPDHVMGSASFRGAEVIAHRRFDETVRRTVQRRADKLEQDFDELYGSLAHPTWTFDDCAVVDLGDRTVELLATPGHTPDSICAFLPDEGILIGGDTVVTGILPAIADGDSRQLEETLRSLARHEAAILVAGHGPVVVGVDAVRQAIIFAVDYLGEVRRRLAPAVGEEIDDLLAVASYEEVVGGRFDPDRFGMLMRHSAVVDKIAAELRGPSSAD